MASTAVKALLGVAAAGVGGALLWSALPTVDDPAASGNPAAESGRGFSGPEPWRGQLTATDCPEPPDSGASFPLRGNWLATWDGVPNKRYFGRGQHLDAAQLTIQTNAEGGFVIHGPSWFRDGSGSAAERPDEISQINPIDLESPVGGVLETSLSYYSAPPSTLRLNAGSPDRIDGGWEIRDTDVEGDAIYGSVSWERARPVIDSVVITSEQEVAANVRVDSEASAEFCNSRVVHLSELPVATMTYGSSWGEIAALRANRPKFFVNVFGENLWGIHDVGFDYENTGIEAMDAERIFSDDGFRRVIGLRIRFNIWYDVQPGWYTVYLDDLAIPFQLDIPNFYPNVSLKYVNYDPVNDTERELEEIPLNQVFWVHATVENPERFDDTQPLVVHWRGTEFSAPAERMGDAEYRAGPFMASENLLPSTVARPNDPCHQN